MLSSIAALREFQELCGQLSVSSKGCDLGSLGLLRAVRFPYTAALYQQIARPILYLTERPETAALAMDELAFWNPSSELLLFSAPDPLFYENAAWSSSIRGDRIRTLTYLTRCLLPGMDKPEKLPLVVAPVRGLMSRTLDRRSFIHCVRSLKIGQEISPLELVRWWAEYGYEGTEVVLEPGQFSKRGGLLDVWPYSEDAPFRIDFFGDEIDSVHRFDPSTQRNINLVRKIWVPPASEVIPALNPSVSIELGVSLDFYLPLVHTETSSLLDFLPKNTLILFENRSALEALAEEIEESSEELRRKNVAAEILPSDYPAPYVSWSELRDYFTTFHTLDFGQTENEFLDESERSFVPAKRFGGQFSEFTDFLSSNLKDGNRVRIVSRQAERIQKRCEQANTAFTSSDRISFTEDSLTEGFCLRMADGHTDTLMTDSEIFGWERPKPRKHKNLNPDAPERSFQDLKEGDYVVHVDYGIGVYEGVSTKTIAGVTKEYLKIAYAEGDELFVPVHQADRISNYVGPSGKIPEVTRLGTKDWLTAKTFVRENVLQTANELLELYAKRQVTEGFAFSPDSVWMQNLEGAFPFEETEDQKEAIEKVKADMERARPMDRLICGDVGYGKTEIALRAAFKAACDGKQVAVLVPTTVLAQQHYETFKNRFAPYPVRVEMLSRFRSPKDQTKIIKQLENGYVDVIIGTHRLVSDDVKFKDLGLVIIDEEQRFGVRQKEHMKKLRTKVDVLTMTATPIPRTLYMSLTGVRDISTINTPPYERIPVTTYVGPYSEKMVKQAVAREIERKGQVFFVHNRVESIYKVEEYLKKLLPDARIGVAHGQLHEKELSVVMDQFYLGALDVLLCTSIIESGLDVPNANTLIVDRADKFGLAQLYQIRGRVGRSAQRAYAYFFWDKTAPPNAQGDERLAVIAENTQFGAGYAIAMRDLEMRGAGEILGSRQHGAIASVGFHLYTRMLAQAVRNVRAAKGMDISDEDLGITKDASMANIFSAITVELPIDVGIPETYIEDDQTRVKLIRRMASVTDPSEVKALADEFRDRFGELPLEVENLLFQVHIKLLCEKIGLSAVVYDGFGVLLRYPALPKGVSDRHLPPISRYMTVLKNAYRIDGMDLEGDDWKETLVRVLTIMAKKAAAQKKEFPLLSRV